MAYAPPVVAGVESPTWYARIVVPDDGFAAARLVLPIATWIAERTGADLKRLRVIPPASTEQIPPDFTVVHHRDPARTILAEGRQPRTLIAMTTRGRTRLGAALLGSTAESVIRESGRPLLLIGPEYDRTTPEIRRVLVCVEGSVLSEAMLPVAEAWAAALGVPLEIVQVLPARIEREPAGVGSPPAEIDESRTVRQAAARLSIPAEWEVFHANDPAGPIVEYAARVPGTLIALATHGRSGLQRAAMGSVAMRIARRARGPLLVQRPEIADD
jgi:nucleotide-binding universal stress UspA family protein